MKEISILLFSLLFGNAFSQEPTEKEIKTDVNEVTVFLDGAQITRKKAVEFLPGTTVLKFINLSPLIDAKSIQVKAIGDVTVLSVHHQKFTNRPASSKEIPELELKSRELDDKIQVENTYLSIIKEELAFLQENKNLGAVNHVVSAANLKEAAEFYGSKMTALKLKEIERNKSLAELYRQKSSIENKIRTLSYTKVTTTGEILVKINSKKTTQADLSISYMVSNAGWFPSYDIRAKNIDEPVEIIYKANVHQDTKEDWKDVKLRFSSSDPNITGSAPELKTYFLNYNTLPPVYRMSNIVKGRITDMGTNDPLPGVNVLVQGSTIGTITDAEGNYSIMIPENAASLMFSFIGYNAQTMPIRGSRMDVALGQDIKQLDEVMVVGYGTQRKKQLTSAVSSISNKIAGVNISSLPIPLLKIERQTTVDFEINTPYSVKSDNKNYTVDMEVCTLPASFKYYCVPKIDKAAFLIAYVTDWEKYNLLEGEANIFFENTYVGKTILNVGYATDTLSISLGRDKNVSVNRLKTKDYTSKQFIGTKQEETRTWDITVKNNKSQAINMVILDQVPVSTLEEIEVIVQRLSGARQNIETGEIRWEFSLEPNNKKALELQYSVKYPKGKQLVIE
jgi:hypothetical protein